jgi:hypothetical protein
METASEIGTAVNHFDLLFGTNLDLHNGIVVELDVDRIR